MNKDKQELFEKFINNDYLISDLDKRKAVKAFELWQWIESKIEEKEKEAIEAYKTYSKLSQQLDAFVRVNRDLHKAHHLKHIYEMKIQRKKKQITKLLKKHSYLKSTSKDNG